MVKLAKTGCGVKEKDVWCNRVNELQNHHCRVNLVGDLLNMGHVTGAIRAFQCVRISDACLRVVVRRRFGGKLSLHDPRDLHCYKVKKS